MASNVVAELPGGWLQCVDEQGVFYFNSVTQQSCDTVPPQLAAMMAPAPASVQPQVAEPIVKMTVGEWQVLEDAQGEYYVNTSTRQTYDDPPPQLLQLLGMKQPQAVAASPPFQQYTQQAQQYTQQAQYIQQTPPPVQAAPAQQTYMKMKLMDWEIWVDEQGEFYKHTLTGQQFDNAPQELAVLLGSYNKANTAGSLVTSAPAWEAATSYSTTPILMEQYQGASKPSPQAATSYAFQQATTSYASPQATSYASPQATTSYASPQATSYASPQAATSYAPMYQQAPAQTSSQGITQQMQQMRLQQQQPQQQQLQQQVYQTQQYQQSPNYPYLR